MPFMETICTLNSTLNLIFFFKPIGHALPITTVFLIEKSVGKEFTHATRPSLLSIPDVLYAIVLAYQQPWKCLLFYKKPFCTAGDSCLACGKSRGSSPSHCGNTVFLFHRFLTPRCCYCCFSAHLPHHLKEVLGL